ncbi:MAG: PHP domain-containing protein [Ignavibacteriaceae bacterium]
MVLFNVHSYYSLLTGTNSIDNLIDNCKSNNLSSLALTDTNCMNGLITFSRAAHEAKIKPILGTQITEPGNPNIYSIFLAKNLKGYSKLCNIITSRALDEDFSLFELLKKKQEDLFVITPSRELLNQIPERDNIYAELRISKRNRKETRELYNYALEKNIKCLPSQPVYFSSKDDFILHKVVTAIRKRETVANLNPDDLAEEGNYFPMRSEYSKNWKSFPELLSNAAAIDKSIEDRIDLSKYKFPDFKNNKGVSSRDYLMELAFEGLYRKKRKPDQNSIDRLIYELEVIDELGYSDYFLVVWDIVREAKRRGILSLGRGSVANSLAAYCLDFVDVDPTKNGLFFERFLNRGRLSPPDIDIDFSWRERDEIIKYVFEKYGYDKVAMISTTVTFRARSAFREVAKVFGFTDSEISKYSKFIPWTSPKNLPNLAKLFPESKKLNFSEEPFKTIISIASRLSNFPRHLSIHPSGIVISPDKITNYCSLQYAKNKGLGLIVTQTDMYSMDDLGLVKIDLLSQRSLGVLRDSLYKLKK